MKATIVCGGKGERLRPLTENIPKPMIPIDNKPLLEYLITLCKKHGINEIAISIAYLPEKIKEYFGDGKKWGVKLSYAYESEPLGTAGSLNNFRDFFTEPFVVIYGDNLTNINLTKMIEMHKKRKGLATLYLFKEKIADKNTTPGCIVTDSEDKILEIIERPSEEDKIRLNKIEDERRWTNAGIYVLEPEVISLIPPGFSDFGRDIFPKVLQEGSMYGYKEDCYFREVGQFMRYQIAKEEIESGKIKLNIA